MGLDIFGYRGLTEIQVIENGDYGYVNAKTKVIEENIIECYCFHPEFLDRLPPLQLDSTYQYQERSHFFCSSYHGYGIWRDRLAQIAGYPPIKIDGRIRYDHSAWHRAEGNFWELINFPDNEGIIGGNTIQKLLLDFDRQVIPDDAGDNFVKAYHQI